MNRILLLVTLSLALLLAACDYGTRPGNLTYAPYHSEWNSKYPVPDMSPGSPEQPPVGMQRTW